MAEKGDFPKREERLRYQGGLDERAKRQDSGKKKSGKKKKKGTPPSGKRKINKKTKIIRVRLMVAGVIVLVLIGTIYGLFRKNGTEVFAGEKSIGIIKDTSVKAEDLVNTITAQLENEVNSKIKINEEVKTVPIHISRERKKDAGTLDYMIPQLRKSITYQVQAAVIMVENERAAILKNKEEAEEVYKTIQAEYMEGLDTETIEPSFVENVQTVEEFVQQNQIMTVEQAVEKLQSTTQTQKEYIAQTGDYLSVIAGKADMTLEELFAINPGVDINTKVRVGDVFNILVKKPFISVKTVETQVVTEVAPKNVQYQDDATKDKGYQKVIQKGKDGQKESTKQIIRINGLISEEKAIEEKITQEPVDEIIVRGTK